MARLVALVLSVLAAGGCDDHELDPDAAPPVDGPLDSPPPLPAGFPELLELDAAQVTTAVPFTASASGTASEPFGRVSMSRDVGTLQIDGATLTSFVYMTVPFGEYQLYQGFAVSGTRWDVFWLYCQGADRLAHIYDEGVGGARLFVRPASGVCRSTATPADVQVSVPALALRPPAPFGGYTVTGSDITVRSDGTGTLTLGGRALPLVVFGDVDCSAQLCGEPGWYELHSIVWDEAERRAIFLIAYLINGQRGRVQLTYARSLPDLGDPIGTVFLPATWTAPAARTRRTDAPGVPSFGVPPPALR